MRIFLILDPGNAVYGGIVEMRKYSESEIWIVYVLRAEPTPLTLK